MREEQDQPDRHVRDDAVDLVAVDRPALAEGDDAEGEQGREGGEGRRDDVGDHLDLAREERLLADELDQVGDRLQQAERPGAVRADAELHAPEQLALDQRRVGERDEDEVDDHDRLDQRDPPDLRGRRDERAHSFVTSTPCSSGSTCSAAARTAPRTAGG